MGVYDSVFAFLAWGSFAEAALLLTWFSASSLTRLDDRLLNGRGLVMVWKRYLAATLVSTSMHAGPSSILKCEAVNLRGRLETDVYS